MCDPFPGPTTRAIGRACVLYRVEVKGGGEGCEGGVEVGWEWGEGQGVGAGWGGVGGNQGELGAMKGTQPSRTLPAHVEGWVEGDIPQTGPTPLSA